MTTPSEIQNTIQTKYSEIATLAQPLPNTKSALAPTLRETYSQMEGYLAEADLNLGCGLPVQYANIQPGDQVLDLGCGAGVDCFIAAKLVGDEGYVTGIDFTPAMVERAEAIRAKNQIDNVEFLEADLVEVPLHAQEMDVVVSNCAINMVPDKAKAFKEIHRLLRPGGQFCISDVVLTGDMPYKIKQAGEDCYGYVAGAIDREQYLRLIKKSGFVTIEIHDEQELEIAEASLQKFADQTAIEQYHQRETGIRTITIRGYKAINIKPVVGISGEEEAEEIKTLLTDCQLPANLVDTETETVFSIQYRDELVGLLSFKTLETHGLVTALAIHPAYREQRLASLLHEHFVRDCQLGECRQFYIRTSQSIAWLESKGWTKTTRGAIAAQFLGDETLILRPEQENEVYMTLTIEESSSEADAPYVL